MSLIVILSGAISFHLIIATAVPVPASSSARELRPVEEVLEIEWASGPGLRIPSILLQNIGPWKFCEVYSTDMVCFQLWWQYNGSNIFFLGIRNSFGVWGVVMFICQHVTPGTQVRWIYGELRHVSPKPHKYEAELIEKLWL